MHTLSVQDAKARFSEVTRYQCYSELRRLKQHGAVVAWVKSVEDKDLFLSAVTIGGIQAGIEITREQDLLKA